MKDSEQTRRDVSADYAKAIKSQGSGCCGGPVPKGVVARIAGYNDADFAALPTEAVVNSFGCGNPLAFSEVQPGQVVLDLGSGAGIDLLLAAKKVGAEGKVVGVDMTDEMIAKARENIAAAGLTNAEVRKGIIEELPVDAASVDWVISNCVINLSPEKHRVFAEIARVLQPGGTMLVSSVSQRPASNQNGTPICDAATTVYTSTPLSYRLFDAENTLDLPRSQPESSWYESQFGDGGPHPNCHQATQELLPGSQNPGRSERSIGPQQRRQLRDQHRGTAADPCAQAIPHGTAQKNEIVVAACSQDRHPALV